MALEKKQTLRKVEFIFTEGKVNPEAFCEYDIAIEEDGEVLVTKKYREMKSLSEMKALVKDSVELVRSADPV